ncbi:protein tyrosine phosphatase [Azotosporobacter soli]|uniref:phosphatase domain-containing protein n=1 Tax=Azotosporobacter soli TaxID=3055040 RepID=UPI0031FEB59D
MKIRIWLAAVVLLAVICNGPMYAGAAKVQAGEEFWRIDTENEASLPRNFRTSDDAFQTGEGFLPSRQGLAELHASGSAQFSRLEFEVLQAKLPAPLVIVDLRQESHGLLNGIAVSWYGARDWANVGKSMQEVLQDEKIHLTEAQDSIVSIAPLNKVKRADCKRDLFVLSALSEEEFVKERGVGYFRLTVTDHLRPDDVAVELFLAFYKNLPPGTALHFHCQAGHGRTTTFMAMYDMLKNAKQVSFNDILARQQLLGGANLLQESSQEAWKIKASQERLQFLQEFYAYAAQSPTESWTAWSKQR